MEISMMTDGAIVYSPDGVLRTSRDTLVAAARHQWPNVEVIDLDGELTLHITSGSERFQIFDLGDGMLSTDGNHNQQLEFAAWASMLATETTAGRVVLLNKDASVAAYLRPGMTPEDIDAAWNAEPPE
ncbi:hypothetical protein ACIRON_26810 [Nocardioides sp. NPDC101246]|uniref:hypothetical protein n=1 Tax=Nocardioides sp. NPDC101246 TaxID=3364336 RepID=UPI003801CB5A